MLQRALLYVLMIPLVLGAVTVAQHAALGRTYCLSDALARVSTSARTSQCITLPAPGSPRPSGPLGVSDLGLLLRTLGH